MKAICIKQPWAQLIADGIKTIEIRSWKTKYRGKLLIVASTRPFEGLSKHVVKDKRGRNKVSGSEFPQYDYLAFGQAICIAELMSIEPFTRKHEKAALCDYWSDLYAWKLGNIKAVEPIEIKGKLKLFEVPDELIKEILLP